MATVKRIVCLANSRKLSGRCVAGVEVPTDKPLGWIRPVSARPHQEVSEYERQYDNGADPRVLDIIEVPLLGPQSSGHQTENWLLDPGTYWEKVGTAGWESLEALASPAAPLWVNGHHTYHGLNDQVPVAETASIRDSLRLIHVDGLALIVFAPGAAFNNPKRRVHGRFTYQGVEYRLWVTDPKYEDAYKAKPNGEYQIGECFLTISLGEPYDGMCYKLIAAIIERKQT